MKTLLILTAVVLVGIWPQIETFAQEKFVTSESDQAVTNSHKDYPTLENKFRELASPYLTKDETVFSFKAQAHSFGHLNRPWQTRERNIAGSFSFAGDRFQLRDSLGNEIAFTPESFWRSSGGRASEPTAADHANYLKTSCRFSPQLLLRHSIKTLSASDAADKPTFQTNRDQLILRGQHANQEFQICFSKADSHLKEIVWLGSHEMWGDQTTAYKYLRPKSENGIPFAQEIHEVSFDVATYKCVVTASGPDLEFPPVEIPKSHELRNEKSETTESIEVEKFNDRISFLEIKHTDSRSVIFEFEEYLMVIDAPKSSRNGQLIIDETKKRFPKKPIRYFAFGHHHPHYLGGVRPFIANGTTIVTTKTVAPYLRQLAAQQHSRSPDSLQNNPRELKTLEFEGETEIADGDFKVQIFDIGKASLHTDDYLLFYIPTNKLLFQDDGIWVRGKGKSNARTKATYDSIVNLKLDVETCIQGWPTQNYNVTTKLSLKEVQKSVELFEESQSN
ncbi:MAG: hypothetical protein AB8B55_23400 [Mariniblastus sp.]